LLLPARVTSITKYSYVAKKLNYWRLKYALSLAKLGNETIHESFLSGVLLKFVAQKSGPGGCSGFRAPDWLDRGADFI